MSGLKQLIELQEAATRKKYPNAPAHAIARPWHNDRTSNGLTQCVLKWLSLNGHYAVRVTTTGRMTKGSQVVDVIGRTRVMPGQWIPGTTRRGTADIHAVIKGMHCSIEVKIGRDRLSPDQEKTMLDVQRAGGAYFVVKTFDSFLEQYHDLIRKNQSFTPILPPKPTEQVQNKIIINNLNFNTMNNLKLAATPGLDQAIAEILFQLQVKVSPEKKQILIQQVQIELSKLLPSGQWHGKTTLQKFEAEIKRVREEMEKERIDHDARSLRHSFKNKRDQQANKSK